MIRFVFAAVTVFALLFPMLISRVGNACTTAVISGKATSDGRPLLWKNRDTSSTAHNEVALFSSGRYRAIGIVNAGSRSSIWMGVNEAGFCIENSLSRDLAIAEETKGYGNGALMKLALETCATVEDFRQLLEETNASGRKTVTNFGVIDASGGAAIFETGPKSFKMFDANDADVAPNGYVVRSNFATHAQGLPPNPVSEQVASLYSGERFLRACSLLEQRASDEIELNYILRNMCRDLADEQGCPYPGTVNGLLAPLPSTISTGSTISRTTTVSAAVFHGVRPGEDPALTTMWAILGDPKFSIAVPCWVAAEEVADVLSDEHGAEIGEIAITLRDWSMTFDRTGVRTGGLPGIWDDLWSVEDQIIADALRTREDWGLHGFDVQQISSFHNAVTARAMAAMEKELLEAKQSALGTPPISDPDSPSSNAIRVALYDHSDDSAKGPKNLLRFLTPASGFECSLVRPTDIRSGALANFQVLIVPGGSGSKQAEMLMDEGREAICKFVHDGGGYIGICAGSYLASAHYDWSLGMINARVWDRAHWARGTGTVSIGLTPIGSDLFGLEEQMVDIYYGQGPLLVPGDFPELSTYEVLATYETEVAAKGAPVGAMHGTHAIIRAEYGDGRVICFSPHPETEDGPNALISEAVRWSVPTIAPTQSAR